MTVPINYFPINFTAAFPIDPQLIGPELVGKLKLGEENILIH